MLPLTSDLCGERRGWGQLVPEDLGRRLRAPVLSAQQELRKGTGLY